MAWTKYQFFLALMMVVTGSINTLATKWADSLWSEGKDGTVRLFNHPFLQCTGMFFGELTCLFAYYVLFWYYKSKNYTPEQMPPSVSGSKDFSPWIFLPPAMCDMTATSTMYLGLNLTYPSSFQMLRGALIIFTGMFSVAFLSHRLKNYEWTGIFTVIAGLIIVGLSDFFFKGEQHVSYGMNALITGDLCIVIAQVIVATQMVLEEKLVSGSNVSPLLAVGWEGLFGFTVLSALLVPMYFIPVGKTLFSNPDGNLEDAIDGFYQIKNNWKLALGFSGTIVSIAFFNFSGISVTKQISATTRTVLDSIRTFVIWIFSMIVGWETFSFLQMIGFIVLIFGMFLYNNVVIRPLLIRHGYLRDSEVQRNPNEGPSDNNERPSNVAEKAEDANAKSS